MRKFFIPPYNVQFVECACAPSSGVLRPECHIVPTPTSASSPGSATCRGSARPGSRYTFGAGILVRYIWSWYSCSLYLELVFLFFIFGAGILVHYIWSWYSCFLYLELVFLFIIFGVAILVHYIWSWYSCSLYLELVFLFIPCITKMS